MIAVEIAQPGPPEVLRAAQRKVPEPAVGELLIRVAAAGVNRADVLQRRGLYPPPAGASDIPGLEVAGVVVRLDPAVRGIAVGAPVCALLSGGGYAVPTSFSTWWAAITPAATWPPPVWRAGSRSSPPRAAPGRRSISACCSGNA